ncbi:MAG: type II toxin-antitoxin system prevent-host-death family antitoxin [Chloroflexia bacterium]
MTTKTIDVHDMQAQLNELLALVEAGGEIIVTNGGKTIARLVPASAPMSPRPFGLAAGEFVVPDDFDDPLPESVLREF